MAVKTKHSAAVVNGLTKALLVLSRGVEEVLVTRAVTSALGERMSASKVQILRLLAERGAQTATEVAAFLGVSKPAVTQIIDALVRAKLVSRGSAASDRREISLGLTAKGRQTIQTVRRRQRHVVRNAASGIGAAELKKLIGGLERLAGALAVEEKNEEEFCLHCGVHEEAGCVVVEAGDVCGVMRQDER